MKTIILMAAAIIGIQAHAGMIVCSNEADGEITDYLRVDGLLDDNGDLTVRPDRDSMITFVSRKNNVDLCKGFNISPDKDLVPMGQYWKIEKLLSAGLRVRLNRAEDGVITAKAVDAASGVDFGTCTYIYEVGDSEAVQAKAKALEDINDDPEMKAIGDEPAKDTDRILPDTKDTVEATPTPAK